jgi:Recombinase
MKGIAAELNTRGLIRDKGRPWDNYAIARILTNPKYAHLGTTVIQLPGIASRAGKTSLRAWRFAV